MIQGQVVIFIEWHLKIDGFTVGALPVYWSHPVYYNWQQMHDKQFYAASIIIKYIFVIFILMMAPNSHHLIQISIVEEYRIFRTIQYTFILL